MGIGLIMVPIAIAIVSAVNIKKENVESQSLNIQTVFRDENHLQKALQNYGCRYVSLGNSIDSSIDGSRILFQRNQQDVFEAVFSGPITFETAQSFINDLQAEYTKEVQQQVYRNLLARSQEHGFVLETEEIQQDNSIVLTFNIL